MGIEVVIMGGQIINVTHIEKVPHFRSRILVDLSMLVLSQYEMPPRTMK